MKDLKNNKQKEKELKRKSKFLSLILRHKPEVIGLILDENGWANIDELLSLLSANEESMSFAELEEIVVNNTKQRFKLSDDRLRIRANQGHSIDIELALEPKNPPDELYHGTSVSSLAAIFEQGILKRQRQHVHLSSDKETALSVGSRHGKPIILQIDAGRMAKDGSLFFLSDNGVWLVDKVLPDYILNRNELRIG